MIRYFWPSDDEQLAGQSKIAFHAEDGDWWAGVQKCGATLALAASLALTAASTVQARQVFSWQQDDPLLHGQPDELYWQQPAALTAASTVCRLFTDDDVIVPQAVAFGPEEEFWVNPIRPVQWSPPIVFRDDDTIVPQPVPFQPDEDFWINPVQSVQASFIWPQQFAFDEQSPVLFGQFDEDFWQAPPPWNLWKFVQAFADDSDFPTPPAAFIPDEDFWVNPVAPIQSGFLCPQQWTFDEQVPALFGQFDEDFWQNPAAPVPAFIYQQLPYWFDSGEIVPQPVAATVFVSWIADDFG
jgi:hypothetical protein